ncbi:MAG: hypothetical protein ACK40G_12285 [Cytophagaceae bacterium]
MYSIIKTFRILPFFIFFFNAFIVYSQPYQKTVGEKGNEVIYGSTLVNKGGVVSAGYTESPGYNADGKDVLMFKVNSSGGLDWNFIYKGEGDQEVKNVIETTDEGFVLVGYTTNAGSGKDILVMKTDKEGGILWQKSIGTAGEDEAMDVVERVFANDTAYAITGFVNGTGKDLFILIISKSGNINNFFRYAGTGDDIGTSIALIPGGSDFILGGYTNSTGSGNYDVFMINTDWDGSGFGGNFYNSGFDDFAHDISVDQLGLTNYYSVVGSTKNTSGNLDMFYFAHRGDGELYWNRRYHSTEDEELYRIKSLGGMGLVACGYTTISGNTDKEAAVMMLDWGGNMEGRRRYSGCNDEIFYAISCKVNSDQAFLSGTTSSYGAGSRDALLLGYSTVWGFDSGCQNYDLPLSTSSVTWNMVHSTDYLQSVSFNPPINNNYGLVRILLLQALTIYAILPPVSLNLEQEIPPFADPLI